ncbi:reverse transcriptase [Plakobranchus ocellatus]|uniref:Reverse transcriptase n=1 Tax=Plakobranchus ocellatus TaxID=259542 RepID=A0AAV4BJ47_9GAST|nr:reverse transcriptase [Plakobranchus ocellatus]
MSLGNNNQHRLQHDCEYFINDLVLYNKLKVAQNVPVALSQGRYTWRHNRVLQELASVISTASTSSTVFITEGGVKKWHGGSIPINTHRKDLLDGCDDWVVSADFPEWERHPDVIRKTALRPDIVIHSASTQQIILVELIPL